MTHITYEQVALSFFVEEALINISIIHVYIQTKLMTLRSAMFFFWYISLFHLNYVLLSMM